MSCKCEPKIEDYYDLVLCSATSPEHATALSQFLIEQGAEWTDTVRAGRGWRVTGYFEKGP